MDSIKATAPVEVPVVGKKSGSGSEEATVSFSSILKTNSDAAVQSGTQSALNAMWSRKGQGQEAEIEAAPGGHRDDRPEQGEAEIHEPQDDHSEQASAPTRDHDDNQRDARPSDDNHPRENASTNDDSLHDDAQPSHDTDQNDSGSNDEGSQNSDDGGEATETQSGDASNEGETAETATSDSTTTTVDTGEMATQVAAITGTDQAQSQVASAKLSSESKVVAAGGSEQATAKTAEVAGGANATKGLDKAAANIGKNAGPEQAAQGETQTNDSKARSDVRLTPTQVAAQAAKAAQQNTQAPVDANAQNKADPTQSAQKAGMTQAQAQAQDLSKRIGPDQKIDVNVNVTNEAKNLTSRPNLTLTPNNAQANSNSANQTTAQTAQQATAGTAQTQLQAAQTQNLNNAQAIAATQQGQQGVQNQGASQATAGATVNAAGGVESLQPGASVQAPGQLNQPGQAQTAQKAAAQPQAHSQRAVVDQVTVQITKALNAGADKINIQLKPAHLGRIDIQLEMRDGNITATVVADNKDTLELMKNGARDLARALNSAGLNTDPENLNFSLREQANQHANQQGKGGADERLDFNGEGEDGTDTAEHLAMNDGGIIEEGRIDIRA